MGCRTLPGVQEAMALGVKLLVIPLAADQPCNAAEVMPALAQRLSLLWRMHITGLCACSALPVRD